MENNPHLKFVLRHYREGAFDTSAAIGRFRRTAGIPDRRYLKYISAAAAAVAILICISIFNSRPQPAFVAAADVAHTVFLPDGTNVVLSPY